MGHNPLKCGTVDHIPGFPVQEPKWEKRISWSHEMGVQEARLKPPAHSNSRAPESFPLWAPGVGEGTEGGRAEGRFGRTLPFVKSLYKTQHCFTDCKTLQITTIKNFAILSWKLLHKQLCVFFTQDIESILSSADSSKPPLLLLHPGHVIGQVHWFSALQCDHHYSECLSREA